MKHVILDFDGVVADTFEFHLAKMKEMYAPDLTAEMLKSTFTANFFQNKIEAFDGVVWSEYAQTVGEEQADTEPFEGAVESIKEFSQKYTLHLVSSGWEAQIFPFLEKHGLKNLFTESLCADSGTSKHEKLERLVAGSPEEYIFVTDTIGDVEESKAVSVPVIAVTFGFLNREEISPSQPDYTADSWDEVKALVHSHFE